MSDAPPFLTFEAALGQAVGDIAGLRVADIGAGSGEVSRQLAKLGADVTGIEPQERALHAAMRAGGGASYAQGGAEATGMQGAVFDLVVFSRSLHHCGNMDAALREACRLLRPSGRILVLEPVSPDPFWPVIRLIDDESDVHRRAIAAMDALDASGRAVRTGRLAFASRVPATSLDETVARILSVDPRRRLDPAQRPALAEAFETACAEDDRGRYIPHWNRIDVLSLRRLQSPSTG